MDPRHHIVVHINPDEIDQPQRTDRGHEVRRREDAGRSVQADFQTARAVVDPRFGSQPDRLVRLARPALDVTGPGGRRAPRALIVVVRARGLSDAAQPHGDAHDR